MRINYFIVPFLLFIAGFSFPQGGVKTLTIDEAVEQALNNNAQLKYQNYEIQKAEGLLTKAGIIPNPEASFFKEDLSFGEGINNNPDYNEWTITGSLPINFLWNRWSAVNSASSLYDAEMKRYEYLKTSLIADVKSGYAKYHFYNKINKAWHNTLGIIEHAQQTAQAREEEGEISGYDNQRILLEYLIFKKNETESNLNLQNSLNELSLLLYPAEPYDSIQTKFTQPDIPVPDFPSLQSLIENAKKYRTDLSAEKFTLENKESSLSNEQIKIIPELSISLGYKKQSDELKGLVYGFNIGIPLFNRNQGDIQIAEAELNQQNILVESLSKKIEQEVSNAYKKLKECESQLTAFNKYNFLQSEEIITTAQFSYEEGEMTLVELIDALRAYSDSFRLKYELLLNYYLSLFDLEKTIGKELIK